MENKKYLNIGQKLVYGSGDLASNFAFTFVSSFVMIYLTDTVGLDSFTIGVLMMTSKLLDGVTDVFFGSLVDKTHSKWGKARPWMFWSTFPLGICVALQFMIPEVSSTLQYAYFFIVYTLMNAVFYTANNISYSTLCALITRNNQERVQLGAFRFVFALIAAMVISSITPGLVVSFGGGASGWRNVALLYALLLIAINTLCVLCVKELPEEDSGFAHPEAGEQKGSFIQNIKHLLKNKYYLMILGIYIANNLMSGVTTGVGVFYMSYVLGDASLLGLFSMMGMLPMMLSLMITPMLVKKWGMYKINLISMGLAVVVSIPYYFVGMNKMIPAMLVLACVRGFLTGPITGSLNALIAESSRYTYLKSGIHIEGTVFSCSSMGIKLGGGIGSALCGWLLALGGYDGMAAVQTAGALNMISFMYIVIPILVYIVMFLLVWRLDVEKANKELESAAAS